ncbi:hypothetical protein PHISP_00857 [Aspergillus sp. HF37]|nr:hypothetical protein PHISP_00857 [Aspergillus sp. HF37]
MGPLAALEHTLEKCQQYKSADRLRSLNKALTGPSAENPQKTWLEQMWQTTYELDDLQQRVHYLEQQVMLNKGTTLQLQTVFEHLAQKPNWSVAKDAVAVMEHEVTTVQARAWDMQDEQIRLFKMKPEGAWIRELAASIERNDGRDFWEKGRRECVRAGGCCARNCGCCVGWFLHCSQSCPCCLWRTGGLS